jgi:hypothetical protein
MRYNFRGFTSLIAALMLTKDVSRFFHDCSFAADRGYGMRRLRSRFISAGRTAEEDAATDLPAEAVTGISPNQL